MVQSVMCPFVGMLELEIVKSRTEIGRHQLLPNVRDVVGRVQKRSAINKVH